MAWQRAREPCSKILHAHCHRRKPPAAPSQQHARRHSSLRGMQFMHRGARSARLVGHAKTGTLSKPALHDDGRLFLQAHRPKIGSSFHSATMSRCAGMTLALALACMMAISGARGHSKQGGVDLDAGTRSCNTCIRPPLNRARVQQCDAFSGMQCQARPRFGRCLLRAGRQIKPRITPWCCIVVQSCGDGDRHEAVQVAGWCAP